MKKPDKYRRKLDYNNAYNRENYHSFSVRFDIKDEKKIIRWLEKQPGVKSYISGLIEADMKKAAKKRSA